MIKLICFSTIQCMLLAGAQVFLKFAMLKVGKFGFNWPFFKSLLLNWPLAASGACMLSATLIWVHIIKRFDLSVAYPLISISYIFGMLAAVFVFHETVPPTRWIGVGLIVCGVFFIAR